MFGYDIASYQAPLDISQVACDFVIVKATQGTSYVNPAFKKHMTQALSLGKLVGCYHYASRGGAEKEAQHFLDTCRPYIGKAILVLDWEQGDNANWGSVAYAKRFMDYVRERTGITCLIYMSKSVCREYNWSQVANTYPLWVAQYANYKPMGYVRNPWTDKGGYGAWNHPMIFQYTSSGRLPGWNGNLDLDVAFCDRVSWQAYASYKEKVDPVEKPMPGKQRIDTSKYPTVRYGHKNEWVRLLQNALTVLGFFCAPDGIFGNETSKRVREFQASRKLVVDGVVGQKTWAALFR